VSKEEDGPPGPDVEEGDIVVEVDDNYKRRNEDAKLATLINDQFGEAIIDASQYTDEWWARHEQELANDRARNAARAERARMRHRAEMLMHTEGQAGARCRFPRRAVEAAQNLTRPTRAMTHTREFLENEQKVAAAAIRKLLGEREEGDDKLEPLWFLVLAGGTGGGKTTAATWLGLKGDDPMPGFIRASELERRGRYDKDLKTWIPERTSLVIDDLGAELLDGKGVFRSWLDEIVDAFYSSKRRLIITTNLKGKIDDVYRAECAKEGRDPEPQFVERYGDRVRSRVKQIGTWAECGNTDLRENPR
jgi:hypothetical protein